MTSCGKVKKKIPERPLGDLHCAITQRGKQKPAYDLAETLETEHAALLGVEGIVRADTDVDARMDVGAALAHKNVAGENELTVSALGTKALGVGVAAVLRGAAALLVGEKLKTDVQHGDLPSFL